MKKVTTFSICVILLTSVLFVKSACVKEVHDTETAVNDVAVQFYIKNIDDNIFERIKGKSYKEDSTIPLSDLRYLHILHKDLRGKTLEGEMICNISIAKDVLDIFKKLYEANYPIERVRFIDEYNADDETSMRENNTFSFNFRFISGTKKVSKHGLGMAVDINPLYNPYVKEIDGKVHVEPLTASEYVDRKKNFPYKIDKNDLAYKLFTEHGFEWGGNWKSLKDYQHFEMPDVVVKKLYKN